MPSLKTLAVLALLTAPLSAATLDEVLDKHFEALGGKDKINSIQSAKMVAKQVMGPQELPVTISWKRPDKVRMEFTLQGMTGIQSYDGKTAEERRRGGAEGELEATVPAVRQPDLCADTDQAEGHPHSGCSVGARAVDRAGVASSQSTTGGGTP